MRNRKFKKQGFFDRILENKHLSFKNASILKKMIVGEHLGVCCFCNKTLNRRNITIEHIIPASRLSPDQIRNIDYMALSCYDCNLERATADFHQFRLYIQKKIVDPPVGCKKYILQQNVNRIISKFYNNGNIEIIIEMFKCGESLTKINKISKISKKNIKRILKEQGLIKHMMAYY